MGTEKLDPADWWELLKSLHPSTSSLEGDFKREMGERQKGGKEERERRRKISRQRRGGGRRKHVEERKAEFYSHSIYRIHFFNAHNFLFSQMFTILS